MHGPKLNQQPHLAGKTIYRKMWLFKVSMQNKFGPLSLYLHFCEQDVTWSFYSEVLTSVPAR